MLLVRVPKSPEPSRNENPDAKLNRVFQAAQKTDFYRCWIDDLNCSPNDTLDLLPHVDIQHYIEEQDRFRNRRASRRLADLIYPLNSTPRIALFAGGFRHSGNLTSFKRAVNPLSVRLDSFDTIAAPVNVLRQLIRRNLSLSFPVIAFTGPEHGYLNDMDRDQIWRAFGVPVFEQLTALDNDVVATECEAHDGLHIRTADAIFEHRGRELVVSSLSNHIHPVLRLALGITGEICHTFCPCGAPGPRLVNVADYRRQTSTASGPPIPITFGDITSDTGEFERSHYNVAGAA